MRAANNAYQAARNDAWITLDAAILSAPNKAARFAARDAYKEAIKTAKEERQATIDLAREDRKFTLQMAQDLLKAQKEACNNGEENNPRTRRQWK